MELRDWLAAQSQGGASFSLRMTRPFYRWLVAEGIRQDDPTTGIRVSAPMEPQTTATDAQVASMLASSRRSPRDHTIIALLVATGARRGEIGHLTIADLATFIDSGMVRISRSKTVPRVVPIDPTAEKAVRRWLRHARFAAGGAVSAWGVRDGANLVGRAVERHGGSELSPHAVRRWFVTTVARRGMSSASIGRQLGWSSGTTATMIGVYTRATAAELLLDEYRRVMRGSDSALTRSVGSMDNQTTHERHDSTGT